MMSTTTIFFGQPIFSQLINLIPRSKIDQLASEYKSDQKLHLKTGIPVKVYHSHATEHDCLLIQHRDIVNPDEIVLFDKAYNNYKQFAKWNEREKFCNQT